VGITWLTTKHPWFAAAIAATLTLLAILAARWIIRLLRRVWKRTPPPAAAPASSPPALSQ
jgi:hypothetical protein